MSFIYGGVCRSVYRTCNAESCPVFFASLGPVNDDGYFVCRKANGDLLSNIDIIFPIFAVGNGAGSTECRCAGDVCDDWSVLSRVVYGKRFHR